MSIRFRARRTTIPRGLCGVRSDKLSGRWDSQEQLLLFSDIKDVTVSQRERETEGEKERESERESDGGR